MRETSWRLEVGYWSRAPRLRLPQIIGPAPRPALASALKATQPKARNKSTHRLSLLPQLPTGSLSTLSTGPATGVTPSSKHLQRLLTGQISQITLNTASFIFGLEELTMSITSNQVLAAAALDPGPQEKKMATRFPGSLRPCPVHAPLEAMRPVHKPFSPSSIFNLSSVLFSPIVSDCYSVCWFVICSLLHEAEPYYLDAKHSDICLLHPKA